MRDAQSSAILDTVTSGQVYDELAACPAPWLYNVVQVRCKDA